MYKEYSVFNSSSNFYPIDFFKENTIRFHDTKSPRVSIIIPVFNEVVYTLNCLYSLQENIQDIDYEIIVINDNSTDNTQKYLSQIPNLKIINNETNLGFLRNVNKAINIARGEFVLIFNNDILVLDNFLKHLLDVFYNNDNVGAVGSMLIFKDLKLQEAGALIKNDANCINLGRGKKPYDSDYNYIREVDYCSGCCLLTKRFFPDGTLISLDEQFLPAYYEETDLCMRLRYNYNLKIIYQPLSKIIHFESISYSNEKEQKKNNLLRINREKFLNKWRDALQDNLPFYKKIIIIVESAKNKNYDDLLNELKKNQDKYHVVYYSDKKMHSNTKNNLQQEGIQVISSFIELSTFIKQKTKQPETMVTVCFIKDNFYSRLFNAILRVCFFYRKNISL